MSPNATSTPSSPLLRAYVAIEELEARLARLEQGQREPIAIVGMACRFPGGVHDPEGFWRLLHGGGDAMTEVPSNRWDIEAVYDPNPDRPGKMYTRQGGFLAEVDRFDPLFFGIAPREAASMDPQHRLLLEVSWEALERAGQAPDRLAGSATGVFVGIMNQDWTRMPAPVPDLARIDTHTATGGGLSFAAGRISYLLGLQGPSLVVDTACSSSLVAVHLACQSLRAGECRLALAGGVNLILLPDTTISLCRMRALAPDGRCKTFDAAADGYARGEGCGIVVLKRLSDAQTDGDAILAVIRGSAVNHDGPSGGLTVPSGPAQQAVIRNALARAGIEPAQVSFIETHGTGTVLGDPIEVHALAAVFGPGRDPAAPLMIGSVKTNFGHLESAAGVASLMKTVLAIQHREVPPHLHLRQPNPHVAWHDLPLTIPARPTPWPAGNGPRRAGVSSFGLSGINAHLVVEESPPPAPVPAVFRPLHLLCLSAREAPALTELAQRCAQCLSDSPQAPFADVCFTANVGRAHWNHRLAVVAASAEQARDQLTAFATGKTSTRVIHGLAGAARPRVAFLFTGQGSQYAGMARHLHEISPTFRQALDRCAEVLRPHLPLPLLQVLHPDPSARSPIDETAYTQPALFAVEYALAELWRSWGIEPEFLLGHSVGEYVAACQAGVFSLEDALTLVAIRSRLMQELPRDGAMAAVFADTARVTAALAPCRDRVSLAAVNGPNQVVVSGDRSALATVLSALERDGIACRWLKVSHAFHSPLLDPLLDRFEEAASAVKYAIPRSGLVSNLTGRLVQGKEVSQPGYWRRHAREPVQFAAGMRTLREQGCDLFVEIGPHPVLVQLGRHGTEDEGNTWLCSLRQGRDDWQQMLETAGELYIRGAPIDWAGFHAEAPGRKCSLPTYPFQRQRLGFEPVPLPAFPTSGSGTLLARPVHPLLGRRLRSALKVHQFENELRADRPAYLADHRVQGLVLMPAAGFLEMAQAGARIALRLTRPQLEEVIFLEPLVLTEREPRLVQVVFTPEEAGGASFRILSQPGDDEETSPWTLHASGKVSGEDGQDASASATDTLQAARERCREPLSAETFHQRLMEGGVAYGPGFRQISRLWRGPHQSLAELRLPETLRGDTDSYGIHPALLDACLQVLAAAQTELDSSAPFIPFGVDRFLGSPVPHDHVWCHTCLRVGGTEPDQFIGDLRIFDDRGKVLAALEGLRLRRMSMAGLVRAHAQEWRDWLYEMDWQPRPLLTPGVRPDYLAAPGDIIEPLRDPAEQAAARHGLADDQELGQALDRLATVHAIRALGELGWRFAIGAKIASAELAERLGAGSKHHHLLNRLLAMLAEDGCLEPAADGWVVRQVPPAESVEAWTTDIRTRFPVCASELALLNRCGERLAEVLRGQCDPLELLFPKEAGAGAGQVYEESSLAQAASALMATALATALARLPVGRTVRILEIGAGTGATTGALLPCLPAAQTEYVFTDIAPFFLTQARERFRDHSFVRYQVLDIETDPLAQGFSQHAFDVIVAANVLHATRELKQTLRHVQTLLAPGGLLLLQEATGPQRWLDLIFGLTEGWWRFADPDLRPAYPLLTGPGWQALLHESRFAEVRVFPAPDRAEARQALIVARTLAGPDSPSFRNRPGISDACWLIFADDRGTGAELSRRLRQEGESCLTVIPGDQPAAGDGETASIRIEAGEDYVGLIRRVQTAGRVIQGIVHLWSLDAAPAEATSSESLAIDQFRTCGSVLHLVQALARAGASARLWLVTAGGQSVAASEGSVEPIQSLPWGLGRVLFMEHPELRPTRIDLDPAAPSAHVDAMLAELLAGDGEDQIAYRAGSRRVARLRRSPWASRQPEELLPVPEISYRLEMTCPGQLAQLTVGPAARRHPGPGEVEIQVAVTGLNFLDVMGALAALPEGGADFFGGECSGTVVALGEGVEGLALGDEVVAVASGSFASHVITSAHLAVRKPNWMTHAEAATIPIAFLTAWRSLVDLGRLARGERVLIHAAAGGVGLAAVQLAQRAGAVVHATAGSPTKRAFLHQLEVAQVCDSRSLAFADDVLWQTGGRGVNLVLNCLSGEFIPCSLKVLAHGGRFLEIGKRAVWTAEQVAGQRGDVTYCVYDLLRECREDPERVGKLLRELMKLFDRGVLRPLPLRVFPIEEVIRAFRFMQQARHIGKIVVAHQPGPAALLRSEGTYLITGGLGGLGLEVAQWLTEQGVRSLVLIGRSEPGTAVRQVIQSLEQAGTRVLVRQADVTDRASLAAILDEIDRGWPPLRGIIHAAGVLADGVLLRQDWARFARVLAPKAQGAWNLHELSQGRPLDFFVLFSSAASLLGSAGQANHAAANAFLDGLAHHRRSRGLPALSINWGVWSGVGAAAGRDAGANVARLGMGSLAPAQGLLVLGQLLRENPVQAGAMPIDWPRLLATMPSGRVPSLVADLAHEARGTAHSTPVPTQAADWRQQIERAVPGERRALLTTQVRAQVVRVLGLPPRHPLAPRQPFRELGLDSLMAVELRNGLSHALGSSLPATLLFDYPTLEALVGYLANQVLVLETPSAPAPAGTARFASSEPIAVVGLGCRFPGGADSPEAYWHLLRDGVDAIREVPPDRWNVRAYYDPDPEKPGKMYTCQGGFLDRVDLFDPLFFGISPREAASIDPQQRLLIEVAWEALEDAALAPDRLVGSATGVFIGICNNDYSFVGMDGGDPERIDLYSGTSTAFSIAAGRLSYVLGLQGPSLAIDTACSSSLVAVHLACQSLRNGECDLALAGGVNLILSPLSTIALCKLRALARDGRCRTFAAGAEGYGRGEGCGLVVLKRLVEAEAAGDRILAVIRGSAVNQDGRSSGLTAPNGPAQSAVIRKALAQAQVEPVQVSYVEAHGTGTSLGDPIEVQALAAVLGPGRDPQRRLRLGSVKTNFGHLESAAGIAGLIKVVLALQHRELPPHLHWDQPNPHLDWDRLPVEVVTRRQAWSVPLDDRRWAGVSSFGYGGTNAHVVLEEAPAQPASDLPADRPAYLLCLSAQDEEALRELAGRHARWLQANRGALLADVCTTLWNGRAHLAHRLALPAESHEEAAGLLAGFASGANPVGLFRGQVDPEREAVSRSWPEGQGRPRQALEELARAWVQGAVLDWVSIQPSRCRKLSLPTYPFRRDRYWVETGPAASSFGQPSMPPDAQLLEVHWQPAEGSPAPPERLQRWLIFADPGPTSRSLVQILQEQGSTCWVVSPGAVKEGMGSRHYRIDPTDPVAFVRLLQEIGQGGCPGLLGVAYLWGLAATPGDRTTTESLRLDAERTCAGLLHLVQALGSHPATPAWLWLVTRGAQRVTTGPEPLAPIQSLLWGLGRVIAIEHPELRCVCVDLDEETEAASIFAAASGRHGPENQVAWRAGRLYVPRLRERPPEPEAVQPMVRPDGTYLITGGLGGLGLQVGRWLAGQGARHLVLAGRRPPSAAARAVLDALEQGGTRLLVAQTDVAQEEDLRGVLARIRSELPPLRGILHAAGVLDDGVLLRKSWERFAAVLEPKMAGAWNLHALTRDEPLDFFVLFSSASALFGSPGQGNYVAANVFLDMLAQQRRVQGLAGLSINWGPWAEAGMAANRPGRGLAPGWKALPPEVGLAWLGQLLGSATAQAAVVRIDWPEFLGQFGHPGGEPAWLAELSRKLRGEVRSAAERSEFLDQLRQQPSRERFGFLVAHVTALAAHVLRLPPALLLNLRQPLPELGLDSLVAVELRNLLAGSLGRPLPATLLFDYPTVEVLARYLARNVLHLEPEETPAQAAAPEPGEDVEMIERLSEAELDQLILKFSEKHLGKPES